MAALALALLAGCSRPPGMAGCTSVRDGVAREECRYTEAKALVDDDAKLRAALALVPDDTSRDLVLYRLAVDHPARAPALCGQVRTTGLREKCDRFLGRPHLAGVK